MENQFDIFKVTMGTVDESQDLRTSWPNEFSYECIGKCVSLIDSRALIWKTACDTISSVAYDFGDDSWQRKDYNDGLLTEIMVNNDCYRKRILIGIGKYVDDEVRALGNIFNLSDIEAAFIMKRVYENTKDM